MHVTAYGHYHWGHCQGERANVCQAHQRKGAATPLFKVRRRYKRHKFTLKGSGKFLTFGERHSDSVQLAYFEQKCVGYAIKSWRVMYITVIWTMSVFGATVWSFLYYDSTTLYFATLGTNIWAKSHKSIEVNKLYRDFTAFWYKMVRNCYSYANILSIHFTQ